MMKITGKPKKAGRVLALFLYLHMYNGPKFLYIGPKNLYNGPKTCISIPHRMYNGPRILV